MKNKLIELDVDFIGGQEKMTKEEELLISEYIKKSRERYLKALLLWSFFLDHQ